MATQKAEGLIADDEVPILTPFGGGTQGLGIDVDEEIAMSLDTIDFDTEFDAHFGLLQPQQTVIVRPYSDDSDDRLLAEIRPRFIVMYEPNQDFIRRIEVHAFDTPPPSACEIICIVVLQKLKSRARRPGILHGIPVQLRGAQVPCGHTQGEGRIRKADQRAWGTSLLMNANEFRGTISDGSRPEHVDSDSGRQEGR